MALIITEIISEYGPYLNKGQNKASIKQKLFQPPEMAKNMTVLQTNNDVIELANTSVTSVIQQYQSAFTPNVDLTITPNKIVLDHMKVDVTMNPFVLESSWLAFLRDGKLKAIEFPFIAYMIEQQLIPKILEDIELKGIYKGATAAYTPGTATAATAAMNGIGKLFKTGIPLGKYNRNTALSAITDQNVIDMIDLFVKGIDYQYWGKPMTLFCSPERYLQYTHARQAAFNYSVNNEEITGFTNVKIKGHVAMAGQETMFITPKSNINYVTKDESHQNVFDVQPFERTIKILTDFKVGVGFGLDKEVWVYMPDSELNA